MHLEEAVFPTACYFTISPDLEANSETPQALTLLEVGLLYQCKCGEIKIKIAFVDYLL